MKKLLLTAALALPLVTTLAGPQYTGKQPVYPLPAPAPPKPACNNISYDFFEAAYVHSFVGDGADGYGLALNKLIAGGLFATADYNQFFNPDEFYIGGGLGYFVPVTSCLHWVNKAGLVYSDTQYDSALNGNIGTGFRIGVTNWLQLDVFYHGYYAEFSTYTSSGSAALVFRELLAPKMDMIVSGSVGEGDYQAMSAGLRYNF
jgi:hypothetical protein